MWCFWESQQFCHNVEHISVTTPRLQLSTLQVLNSEDRSGETPILYPLSICLVRGCKDTIRTVKTEEITPDGLLPKKNQA